MNAAICVDASVAVKWLLPEEGSAEALSLLQGALSAGTDVVGPPHLPVEVTSAIYKRLRQHEITLEEARDRLRAFAAIPVGLALPDGLNEKALELAAELGWAYPYDAFYLAVGEIMDCEVWTADEEFYQDSRVTYPRVRSLTDYARS